MENFLFPSLGSCHLEKSALAESWAKYIESLLFSSLGPCHLEKSILAKSWARYMESLLFPSPGPCHLDNLFMAIEFFNLQKGSFVVFSSGSLK